VYALFNGDLRGTLQALDAAVTPPLGYAEGGPHAALTASGVELADAGCVATEGTIERHRR
jgi:hypothetical protein